MDLLQREHPETLAEIGEGQIKFVTYFYSIAFTYMYAFKHRMFKFQIYITCFVINYQSNRTRCLVAVWRYIQ